MGVGQPALTEHALSLDHFDALASGRGGPDTVRLLLAAEYSRRLHLVRALLDVAARTPELLGPLPPASAAWDALVEMHRRARDALDAVLLRPQVGTWLSHSLRRVRNHAGGETPIWVEVGQVYAVAVAAAVRGGVALRTRVPVRHGGVVLPTLGLARLPDVHGFTVADAQTTGGMVRLRSARHDIVVRPDSDPDSEHWWQVRRIRCRCRDRTLAVDLDDIDPFRNLADPVLPERLDDDTVRAWARSLDEAWAVLSRWHPGTADAMAVGMMSIAPLGHDPSWQVRSASTGDGFGGALISLPRDPVTMAVTLVHEFQHIKLGGLLQLTALLDDEDGKEDLYAPWRPDPRPLAGLLQGVYAFFGITEFWRRQRRVERGDAKRIADFEFAYARRQTWMGLRTVMSSGRLTEWGGRLVRGLYDRLRIWLADAVAGEPAHAAWAATADHQASWRIRHVRADLGWVANATSAWVGRHDPPRVGPLPVDVVARGPTWTHPRLMLYRLRLTSPGCGSGSAAPPADAVPDATDADVALIDGDTVAATGLYLARIRADAADFDAWTGLGLALAARRVPGWRLLVNRPELVRALHQSLATRGNPPSPLDLSRWLAGSRL